MRTTKTAMIVLGVIASGALKGGNPGASSLLIRLLFHSIFLLASLKLNHDLRQQYVALTQQRHTAQEHQEADGEIRGMGWFLIAQSVFLIWAASSFAASNVNLSLKLNTIVPVFLLGFFGTLIGSDNVIAVSARDHQYPVRAAEFW